MEDVEERFQGKNFDRTKREPLEHAFAIAWQHECQVYFIPNHILADEGDYFPLLDEEHKMIATIIQWLGSPMGQGFLAKSLGVERLDRLKKLVGG